MRVEKTKALVKNSNPRKEGQGDEMTLATDVSVEFIVNKDTVDELIATNFSKQFFSRDGNDPRLEHVTPVIYAERIEDLSMTLTIGAHDHKFEPASIGTKAKFTPVAGGYWECACKLQVHPTQAVAGKLDNAVKEWVELEVHPLTDDMLDGGAD